MKANKRKKLEAAGWRIGSAEEFLGLSDIESLLVEFRLALSHALKERRTRLHWSQQNLATHIQSSQSRVAKMEAADPDVSFELLLRGLLATGATAHDVARAIESPERIRRKVKSRAAAASKLVRKPVNHRRPSDEERMYMPLQIQLPKEIAAPRSWDEAIKCSNSIGPLRAAVDFFRPILGANWNGWTKRSHLARTFHTSFQGQLEWVRLHQAASLLDGVRNLASLVKDLGSPEWPRHVAAAQALEFCGGMRAAGHRVEIIKNTDLVSPDVRVWLDDRPITIEFKALHDSDAQTPWDHFFDALHDDLSRQRPSEVFPFDAEFFAPALEHRDDVVSALIAIAERGDADVHELPHGAGRARYVADVNAQRMLRFPVDQRDDLDRVVGNLGGKYGRQLRAAGGPTLLVVLTRNMFFAPMERLPAVVCSAVLRLREALATQQTMSGVLLHEEPFEPLRAPVLHIAPEWRFETCPTAGRSRTSLLLQNGAANVALTNAELDVLVGGTLH
jgi:transcriptional regulator with XRE-family HTH domain